MRNKILKIPLNRDSTKEATNRKLLLSLFKNNPINEDELLENIGLFLTTKNFSRLLFFYEMYKKFLNNEGIIIEFGIKYQIIKIIKLAIVPGAYLISPR